VANKAVVRRTMRGVYYLEIPLDVIRVAGLKEGDMVELMPGSAVSVKKDDVIIRRIARATPPESSS